MSTTPIPIFAPDGSVRSIQPDQVPDALSAGGVRAVQMKDPKGIMRYVKETDMPDALKAGGQLVSPPPQKQGALPAGTYQTKVSRTLVKPGMGEQPTPGVPGRPTITPIPGETFGETMQRGMATSPTPEDIQQATTAAGQQAPLALTAATLPGLAAGAVTNPWALIRTLIGGGIGAKVGATELPKVGKALGASPETQEALTAAGGLGGGLIGGGLASPAGMRWIGNKLFVLNQQTGMVEESGWASALSHGKSLPKAVLRMLRPDYPMGPSGLTAVEREALDVRAQDLMRRGAQQSVLDRQTATAARQAPGPSPFAGATSSATPIGNAPLPQAGPAPQQPSFVSQFTQPAAPEPSRIVQPGSVPPPQPVTYESVPRAKLFKMAQEGNIEAGRELIRNPGKFDLPPNFKYMIEEEAKKIPWSQRTK